MERDSTWIWILIPGLKRNLRYCCILHVNRQLSSFAILSAHMADYFHYTKSADQQ
jgi:hypothetical protein